MFLSTSKRCILGPCGIPDTVVRQTLRVNYDQCRRASTTIRACHKLTRISQPYGINRTILSEHHQAVCVRQATTTNFQRQRRVIVQSATAATTIPQYLSLHHNRSGHSSETRSLLPVHPSYLRHQRQTLIPYTLQPSAAFNTITSHAHFSALARPSNFMPVIPSSYQIISTIRCSYSSNGNGGNTPGKDHQIKKNYQENKGTTAETTSNSNSSSNSTGKQANEQAATTTSTVEGESVESMDPRAFLLGTRESLRKVTSWEAGDMMATYSIVLLLGIILIAPIAGG